MAPAPNDPASATETNPSLCGVCPNLWHTGALLTCLPCARCLFSALPRVYSRCSSSYRRSSDLIHVHLNLIVPVLYSLTQPLDTDLHWLRKSSKYCSPACQQRDAAHHNTLCNTSNFQQRPTAIHYRSISFAANGSQPRSVWLLFSGERGYHNIDSDDLARHVSGSPSGSITLTTHQDITPPRELKNMLIVQHEQSMFGNRQPANQCLDRAPSCALAGKLRCTRFQVRVCEEEYQTEAQDLEDGFPLIAFDLDTTSLGPLIAYLKWYAERERDGEFMDF